MNVNILYFKLIDDSSKVKVDAKNYSIMLRLQWATKVIETPGPPIAVTVVISGFTCKQGKRVNSALY